MENYDLNDLCVELISIYSKIYELSLNGLMELECQGKENTKEFDEKLKKINYLKLKEQRIYEKISDYRSLYEQKEIFIPIIEAFCNNNELKAIAMASRLEEFLSSSAKREVVASQALEDLNSLGFLDEDDEIEQYIEIDVNSIDLYSAIKIKFLKKLQKNKPNDIECIEYKYLMGFINNQLEDSLSLVGYNPANVVEPTDEQIAKLYEIDKNEYDNINLTIWDNYALDLFEKISSWQDNPLRRYIDYDLLCEEAKFTLKHISKKNLNNILEKYFMDKVLNGKEYELAVDIYNEIANRPITAEEDVIVYNEGQELDTDEIVNEITTILLEISTYFTMAFGCDMAKDIKQKETYISMIEEGYNKLKKLVNEIKNDPNLPSFITDIEQYIDDAFANPENYNYIVNDVISKETLKAHVITLFTDDNIPNLTRYKNRSVPYYIIKNYKLKNLREFQKNIKNENDMRVFYDVVLSSPEITYEFILNKGDLTNAVVLDDDIIARLLEVDEEEYVNDKNDLLKNHAKRIIEHLSLIPSDYQISEIEKSSVIYQSIALKQAIESLDENDVNEVRNYYYKTSMDNKIVDQILSSALVINKDKTYQKKRH